MTLVRNVFKQEEEDSESSIRSCFIVADKTQNRAANTLAPIEACLLSTKRQTHLHPTRSTQMLPPNEAFVARGEHRYTTSRGLFHNAEIKLGFGSEKGSSARELRVPVRKIGQKLKKLKKKQRKKKWKQPEAYVPSYRDISTHRSIILHKLRAPHPPQQ